MIKTEKEYDAVVKLTDSLVDNMEQDEATPLSDVMFRLIEAYDNKHYPIKDIKSEGNRND